MNSFLITRDLFILCIGTNNQGQLGLCDNEDRNELKKIEINQNFVAISCKYIHTIALDNE